MTFTPPVRRVDRGRNHWYVDADGAKVPGVTTILSNGVPKPALINWAGNTTAEYALDNWDELAGLKPAQRLERLKKCRFEDRDAAARRGTEVHRLAERVVAGEDIGAICPDPIRGHLEAYIRFLDDFDPQPVLIETTVVSHDYGWAGTLDLIADFPTLAGGQGRRLLCDIKTARSGVFGETGWQMAGYRYGDHYVDDNGDEQPMLEVDGCAVIHVRADGCDLVPVTAGLAELRTLRYIAQVAEACETMRDLVGDAILPPRLEVPA